MTINYIIELESHSSTRLENPFMIHRGDRVIVNPCSSLKELGRAYKAFCDTSEGESTHTLSTKPPFEYVRFSAGVYKVKGVEDIAEFEGVVFADS